MTTTDLSTMCPSCKTFGAWHGVAGSHGVFACDECSHAEDYACPDWCERSDHHLDDKCGHAEDEQCPSWCDGFPAVHFGPTFGGHITPQALHGQPVTRAIVSTDIINDREGGLTADGLRELASYATLAATWMEATARLESAR